MRPMAFQPLRPFRNALNILEGPEKAFGLALFGEILSNAWFPDPQAPSGCDLGLPELFQAMASAQLLRARWAAWARLTIEENKQSKEEATS